jgi:hypothetical protein
VEGSAFLIGGCGIYIWVDLWIWIKSDLVLRIVHGILFIKNGRRWRRMMTFW